MAKRSAKTPSVDASTRILVLHGPEDMLKQRYLTQLREALAAAHGDTETYTFDGKSATLADVLDELRSYSLMQVFKLVIVDEADQFLKEDEDSQTSHRAAMERYADEPVDHATLVLRARKWNRGKLDKKIEKVGAVIKCDALKPAEARDELIRRAKQEHGRTLDKAAATMLVDRLGPELMQLDTELGKLALMVPPGGTVDVRLVEQVVGRSSDEQAYVVQEAVFEALRTGSPRQPLSKIHDLVDLGGQPDVLVTYFVADVVRKLNVGLHARRAGVPDFQIAKQLKLWGPRQQAFFAALQKLETAAVARLFDQIVTADARAKSGLGDTLRNLECFCVRLADVAR